MTRDELPISPVKRYMWGFSDAREELRDGKAARQMSDIFDAEYVAGYRDYCRAYALEPVVEAIRQMQMGGR